MHPCRGSGIHQPVLSKESFFNLLCTQISSIHPIHCHRKYPYGACTNIFHSSDCFHTHLTYSMIATDLIPSTTVPTCCRYGHTLSMFIIANCCSLLLYSLLNAPSMSSMKHCLDLMILLPPLLKLMTAHNVSRYWSGSPNVILEWSYIHVSIVSPFIGQLV